VVKKAAKIIERHVGNEKKNGICYQAQKSLVFVVDEMGIWNMKEECLKFQHWVRICKRLRSRGIDS
jgi:hypothetical protein